MTLQKYIVLICVTLLFSCGSTEQVITDNGKVYEIKGDTFKNNGIDVTEQLTEKEKENIQNTFTKKIEARKATEKRQDKLEDKQDELEKIQKEAQQKEKAQKRFESANKKLESAEKKYNKLKKKGKLSPKDDSKWIGKLKSLKQALEKAKKKL